MERRNKLGGYESKLTPRAERKQREAIEYERGWSEGDAQARPQALKFAENIIKTIKFTRPLEDRSAAGYDAFTNHIALSTRSVEFMEAKKFFSEGHEVAKDLLLEIQLFLIHELSHLFSRVRFSSKDTSNASTIVKAESGYKISELRLRQPMRPEKSGTFTKSRSSFEAFNEGVTQRIAEEVFLEYGKRTGTSKEIERLLTIINERNAQNLWRYTIYENEVDSMCEQIGMYVGIPKETVWQSIKRGYFEEPQLFHEETLELFKETFGSSFLEEYRPLGNTTPTKTLGQFDGKYIPTPPEEYAEKWLQHLGITK